MEDTIGKRISGNRKRLGMTQDQLAARLGVTAQAVSKWENDQSCPDITTLPKIAEIFHVSTDSLLGIETQTQAKEAEVIGNNGMQEQDGLHIGRDGLQFKLDSGTRQGSLGIAVLVLLVGALTLAARIWDWDVSFWQILWPSVLLVMGVFGSISKFSFLRVGCALFGGYFLLDNLSLLPFDLGWELALPAMLLLFGISLLVNALKKPKRCRTVHGNPEAGKGACVSENQTMTYHGSFQSDWRRIEMPLLARGRIDTTFGEYTFDLSGVEAITEDCTLEVNCAFGECKLLLPGRFRVYCENETVFSETTVNGAPANETAGTVRVRGSINFGNLVIEYI